MIYIFFDRSDTFIFPAINVHNQVSLYNLWRLACGSRSITSWKMTAHTRCRMLESQT